MSGLRKFRNGMRRRRLGAKGLRVQRACDRIARQRAQRERAERERLGLTPASPAEEQR